MLLVADLLRHEFDRVLVPGANSFRYVFDFPATLEERIRVSLDALSVDLVLWCGGGLEPVSAAQGIAVQISRAMPRETINASAR